MKNKNILILGASGFIGSNCFSYFSKKHNTLAVDVINHYSDDIILDTDFSITPKLIKEHKFDVILNCAGSSNIQASFLQTENDFRSNTVYVQQVLDAIKQFSPQSKFITISSAAVYGNPKNLPIKETDDKNPLSPYAVHKLLSEELVKNYAQIFKLSAISVRIFSAFGPGLHRQFFYDLYSKMRSNKEEVVLLGNGHESRDFVFIDDILNAFEILIDKANFVGEVYNIASGNESFINKTAHQFANIVSYKGSIIFSDQQAAGYPLNWQADISKLKAMGFETKTTLEEGLKNYVNWLKNNSE